MEIKKINLQSLEFLRFLSASLVLLAHFGFLNIPLLNIFLGDKLFLGSIGVDIFFIISGIVMGYSIINIKSNKYNALIFITKRIFRIYPLYLIATVIAFFAKKDENFHSFLLSILMIPSFNGANWSDPIIYLGWTLRLELYFYLLVSFGILTKRKFLVPTLLIFLSLILWEYNGFYFGSPIVIEFLMGFFLSYLMIKFPKIILLKNKIIINFGLFISLALVLFVSTGKDFGIYNTISDLYLKTPRMFIIHYFGEFHRFILWGLPCLSLTYFIILLENKIDWKLSFLGKYTYSFYLIQFFIIALGTKINSIYYIDNTVLFIILTFTLAILSYFSFHLIENPINNIAKKIKYKY